MKIRTLFLLASNALLLMLMAVPAVGQSVKINSGGPAVSPFVADEDFSGGGTISHANTINTSKVTNPAPAAVYQTGRDGNFTYTILGFTPGASYVVRLHFCETYWTAAGEREFNVSINSKQVLTNFDIFATAGGQNIANIQQFTMSANSSGQFVIQFTTVINNSLVNGIEIDSSGSVSPFSVASLSPASLVFGSEPLGNTTPAQSIKLTNGGSAALSISSIAITGVSINDFAQTNTCGGSVAAGSTCTISVTFTPTASGARSANVTFTDNAAGSPQSVSLTGTGTTVADANISPASLAFGGEPLGNTTAAQSITLTNGGSAALSISSIAITGVSINDFAQTNNCASSVAAGTHCTISVTFKPTATGSRTAVVTLTDNATGSPQTVSLSGTGGSTGGGASLSPSSLNFGNEPVDLVSLSQVVTLNNPGNVALSITSIAFTGANPTDFTQVDTCGATVAAGGNCTIAILFTPAASGTRTAALSVTDNASGSPQSVSLSGTGTHDVILAWTASVTPGVVGYNVYRGTASGGEGSVPLNSTPISGTTYTDQNVTAGALYYYVVTAVASNDTTQSADSAEASATVP